jgi:hypothetical protein
VRDTAPGKGGSVFARHVVATVVALSWKRTVVIEHGRWRSRRTAWKPHGANIRNLRTVRSLEYDTVSDNINVYRAGQQPDRSREVLAKHMSFEYEEFEWSGHRTFSASGDGTADVRWPEHALEDGQRVSERREVYRATFSAGEDEYLTELDWATWRRLRAGMRYRLKVSTLSGEIKQVAPLRGSWS